MNDSAGNAAHKVRGLDRSLSVLVACNGHFTSEGVVPVQVRQVSVIRGLFGDNEESYFEP